ncbi:transposase [Geminicoccus sp.]|uniref:transposase n=1 Tax=Geminicoccus sp. TaxID=2024832 RepID=UPI0039C8A361
MGCTGATPSSAIDLGRPAKWPLWIMAEAIFCLVRSGCAWRMLPRHFPPRPMDTRS